MRELLIGLAAVAATSGAAVAGEPEPAVGMAAASPAAGEPEVEVDEAVPFSAAELRSALRLRTAETVPPIQVSASPDADAVVIAIGSARRTVMLDGLRGAAAARLVAVVSLDLLDDAGSAPAAVEPETSVDLETPALSREPVSGTTTGHPRVVVDVSGLYGLEGRGGSVGASVGLRGKLRGLVVAALAVDDGADGRRATHLPVGAGLGLRLQHRRLAFETHGHLVVAPHWLAVRDGAERLTHSEVRFGVGVLALAALRVSGPLWASVTGRFGGYLDRQRYLVGGREVYANDHIYASVSIGVSIATGGTM